MKKPAAKPGKEKKGQSLSLMPDLPPPPRSLTRKHARDLWQRCMAKWVFDEASCLVLESLCLEWERLLLIQERLRSDGIFVGGAGKAKLHPGVAAAQKSELVISRLVRSLGLDLEPVHKFMGRPPGS